MTVLQWMTVKLTMLSTERAEMITMLIVIFLENKVIEINRYGLIGDDTLHQISELFPHVTLQQVQLLDANATLGSSADWYIIQKLLEILPASSTIVLNGLYVIDRPIVIKRCYVSIIGNQNGTRGLLNHHLIRK